MTRPKAITVGAVLRGIEAGRSLKTLERPSKNGELGILRVSAVTWGEFRACENKAMPLGYDPGNVPRPMKGDILISRANTRELVGAPVMVHADHPNLLLSDKILRLVPDEKVVEPRYLLRALRSPAAVAHFAQCAGGTSGSMTNLTQSDIRATPISLPPLSEQRRIAAILDKADALRAKRREAIAKLDQLLQSVFLEMFGDPVTNPKGWLQSELVEICDPDDRVNYGVVQPGDEVPGGVPLVRVGDIEGGKLDLSAVKRIDPSIEKAYGRSRLKGNELLVSCVGSIGTIASVPEAAHGFNIARAITRVPLINPESMLFVRECLRSSAVQRYFAEKTRTVSQPTLNVSFVKSAPVIRPPASLIGKFCEIAEAIEIKMQALNCSEGKVEELFQALQNRAFSGQLARNSWS